ncbi:MAG: hypothetical protein P8J37_10175, partial [Fuerstiella sp.]|nr:hypothetical protein [Fuerstiella sp.]
NAVARSTDLTATLTSTAPPDLGVSGKIRRQQPQSCPLEVCGRQQGTDHRAPLAVSLIPCGRGA